MGLLFKAPVMGEGCEEFFGGVVSQLIEERRKSNNVSMKVSSKNKFSLDAEASPIKKPK